MRIYDKESFIWGLIFLCPLPLFALKIIEVEWWQWLFTAALAAKNLYEGLSKDESERQKHIERNYKRVSQKLFGRYVSIKTNLPLIILSVFFAVALIIRYALDYIIPIWVILVVLLIATTATFYSVGISRQIVEHIENEKDTELSEL